MKLGVIITRRIRSIETCLGRRISLASTQQLQQSSVQIFLKNQPKPNIVTQNRSGGGIITECRCLFSSNPNPVGKGTAASQSDTEEEDEGHEHEHYVGSEEIEQPLSGFLNEHYVPLSPLQKAIIYAGSGLSAFLDPTRAENIATFGEISAGPVLKSLHQKMMNDSEASRILIQKPRINSRTIDLDRLSKLPEDTFGYAYHQFLKRNNVTPDSRLPVQFIQDPELAYVMQRYREVHDLVHTVSGQPTNMLGEVVVKWIEGIQTGLPMCLTGGLFGATRLRPKQRGKYVNSHLRWALEVGFNSRPFLNIFYEERWEQPLEELRYHISPLLLKPPTS